MFDGLLQHGEQPGFEPRAFVVQSPDDLRRAREAARHQVAADLELRMHTGFDAPNELDDVAVVDRDDAVVLCAAYPRPAAPGQGLDALQSLGSDAPSSRGHLAPLLDEPEQ